jgi:plasmid stabilization system protein ParE
VPEIYRILFSSDASRDLDRIIQYVAASSPAGARSLRESILDQIVRLNLFPHRNQVVGQQPSDVRSITVENHIIYFRIIERSKAVRVLRIYHGARIQPKRFR